MNNVYSPFLHSGTYGATDIGEQAARLDAQLSAEGRHPGNDKISDATPQQVFAFVEAHEGRATVDFLPGEKVYVRAWNGDFDTLDYLENRVKNQCEYAPVVLIFQGDWVYQRKMRRRMDAILAEWEAKDSQA